jgi:hypothetical protein
MTFVRKIKKTFFRRQWFSSAQVLELEDGTKEIWPMRRHGLAYDDHRARSGIRLPAHGKHALQTVPYDDMHMDRKMWKKREQVDKKCVHRRVRELRKQKHPFMKRMSFKDVVAMWWLWGIGEMDEITYLPMFSALSTKYIEQKRQRKLPRVLKKDGTKLPFDSCKVNSTMAWLKETDDYSRDFVNIWAKETGDVMPDGEVRLAEVTENGILKDLKISFGGDSNG